MNYGATIAEIKRQLPEKLVQSAERTLEFISHNRGFNLMEDAMYWNTIALAFHTGGKIGIESAMKATADSFGKLGHE